MLDTTAVSALMRGDPEMTRRLSEREPQEVALPQPVIAEIQYGIEPLPRSRRRDHLARRIVRLRETLAVVVWTDEVSRCFGSVKAQQERAGRRRDDIDLAVAAHALAVGAVLVTANLKHMARIPGLRVESWD